MQTRRLERLMRLMVEFGGREFSSAEQIYKPLGISRSQFYRDKATLEEMGFPFTYHRNKGVFMVEEGPALEVEGLTLSEVLALILAVGRLPETGDFNLAYAAMTGLRRIELKNSGPAAELVKTAISNLVTQEAFSCSFDLLDQLREAVNERRRIHLVYAAPGLEEPKRLNVDPVGLVFRRGLLFLEVSPDELKQRFYRAAHIREIVFTPFLSPD